MKRTSAKNTAKKESVSSRGTKSKSAKSVPTVPDSPGIRNRVSTVRKRVPVTSPLSLTFRDLKPSWRSYISYVAYAADEGNEEMAEFMKCLKGLPKKERDQVMPEKLCELSGVRPSDLVGVVTAQVWALQNGESALAASILHPEIVRRTAKAAQSLKWGGRDRELFFRVTGSLPDRKGTTIINNNSPQTAIVAGPERGQLSSMNHAVTDMDKLLEAPTIHVLPSVDR